MFLLKNILNPTFQKSLSEVEKGQLNNYLHQMLTGAPDGSIDGEWQSDGLGYYIHLHIYKELSEKDRYEYHNALIEDGTAWLALYPDMEMVKTTLYGLNTI
jgi:hypothetical protein